MTICIIKRERSNEEVFSKLHFRSYADGLDGIRTRGLRLAKAAIYH
jgi:hypothetical protein